MPVPRTNLFRGDRVRVTERYLVCLKLRSSQAPVGRYGSRVGTIISDTLDPSFDVIVVHWDGCVRPELRRERGYQPEDLELVEDV